jgi:hypothetical protein
MPWQKAAFSKKTLFTSKLDSDLGGKTIKVLHLVRSFSMVLKLGTYWKVDQK